MSFQDSPIRRKVNMVIMLAAAIALLLSAGSFVVYDLITHQRSTVRILTNTGAMLAQQASAALASGNQAELLRILDALKSNPEVRAAAIYDAQGKLLVTYPAEAAAAAFPQRPGKSGYRLYDGSLVLFDPVLREGTPAGVLYLKYNANPFRQRAGLYLGMTFLVVVGSLLVAWALSRTLERQITGPILALAETAKTISARQDFALRAPPGAGDELGLLTDAFNQMLARLQTSEKAGSFLAAIVNSADVAIIGKDLQGIVVSWNIGAERMFGFTAAEMVGQSIQRIVSPTDPEEERQLLEEIQAGRTRHHETVRMRKDGTPLDVYLIASPIKDEQGRIIGVSSIARDITERKLAQQALERQTAQLREQTQLLELASVLARDLEDRIILWTAGMEKMYGWTKAEALGQNVHRLLRTEFPAPLEELRRQLLENGEWEGELMHRRKDNKQLCVFSKWVLQRDIEGKPSAILEVNNDITARKEAEAKIRQMNQELEQRVEARTAELRTANSELEAFTYSVAHDLRAPLRHIDAFARILRDEHASNLSPAALPYLERICAGSRHMSQLVDDLLNLARVGRQELKRQPTPLETLAQPVIQELQREAGDRSVDWRVRPLPTVDCDPGLIKQVFVNLLSNALKYTRPRKQAIIEVGALELNGVDAIYVRDNGVGFNMRYADKLFGVFQRLHRAEDFEGTGVGLATVDRIIRKHGGCAWAEGAVDKGAVFYFTLAGAERLSPETVTPGAVI
jgi:PAS domain S-box-containing protein